MGLFNFLKLPKHQKFSYKPRHWDPEKEERDARLRLAKGNDAEAIKGRVSAGFRNRRSTGYLGTKENKRSNRRLLYVLIILIALTYIFLSKYLPQIINFIE